MIERSATGEAPPFSKSEMMIVAAARELAGQRVCFVGVGLPNIAVNLAKRTVAPERPAAAHDHRSLHEPGEDRGGRELADRDVVGMPVGAERIEGQDHVRPDAAQVDAALAAVRAALAA